MQGATIKKIIKKYVPIRTLDIRNVHSVIVLRNSRSKGKLPCLGQTQYNRETRSKIDIQHFNRRKGSIVILSSTYL